MPSLAFGSSTHPAGITTQVLAFATVALLLAAGSVIGGWSADVTVMLFVAFAAGVGVSLFADLRALTMRVPGIFAAFLALIVLGTGLGIAVAGRRSELALIAPVVALALLGLDWYWAERLRVVAWLTAPVALALAGTSPPGSLVIAALWVAVALGTHGSAERDIARGSALAPVPGSAPAEAPGPPAPPGGLVGSLGVAIAIGLIVAVLVNLALLLDRPKPPPKPLPSASSGGQRQGQGGQSGGGQSGGGQSGGGQSGGSGGRPTTGNDGYRTDRDGDGRADAEDGRGVDQVWSGGPGRPAGAPCDAARGCVAVPGNDRIVVDSRGRVIIDTDRDRLLDAHEDGRLGIDYDGDRVVDSWDVNEIVVDADADGLLRIDADFDGRTDRTEQGSVGIDTNGDGVIDRNGTGRVGVDTNDDGVLDDLDPGWIVVDSDADRLPDVDGASRPVPADPDVVIADGVDPDAPARPSVVPPTTAPGPRTPPDTETVGRILLVLAIGGLVGLVLWWLVARWRRRKDEADERAALLGELASRRWALETLRRLEDEGASRGRARRRSESVLTFAAALAGSELPDERIVEIGRIVDADLFGPVVADEGTRQWATQVLGEVCRAFPPGWREREEREAAGTGGTGGQGRTGLAATAPPGATSRV